MVGNIQISIDNYITNWEKGIQVQSNYVKCQTLNSNLHICVNVIKRLQIHPFVVKNN